MATLANALTVLVVLLHLYFLVLEMFLWTRPTGMRVFRTTPEFAQQSKRLYVQALPAVAGSVSLVLARNQGSLP